ncbi:hypothetical protein [Kineosporia sp. NBRC 101731]|uniref:hypothetical protein n=1 Tax=Kineosporia sp. NBRC 101731 TaxID=3032199 RepID=UPI0024A435C5|nr:hypothetical protein [Kineosporia sp. NBRC 101731]GLY33423.1 hypothetical protein Kisp02_67880 [Kineosporia sp. NBRC 101731]
MTSNIIHLSRWGGRRSLCGKEDHVWVANVPSLTTCKSCLRSLAWLQANEAEQKHWADLQQMYDAYAQVKADWAKAQQATCRTCDTYQDSQAGAAPCQQADQGGPHDWDMHLMQPPPTYPTKAIDVQLRLTVPNDGYDYFVDVAGRLEQVATLMTLHPGVSAVETNGPSGSGYIPASGERDIIPSQN